MPMETGQSQLLAKLGARAAQLLNENKAKEPELPNMGLPAGIDGGIAQVVECKFGKVQEGKRNVGAIFFMAQAIVKKPKEHNGISVAGQRTLLYKELADAKGVVNEKNLLWIQDQMKMLVGRGADPEMFTLTRLESTAARVKQARPHTVFRTWKGDKQDVRNLQGSEATNHRVKPGWWLCTLTTEGSVKSPVEGKGPYASEEFARKANQYAGREPMVNHQWGGVVEYHEEKGPDANAVSYNGQAGVDADAAAAGMPTGVEPPDEPETGLTPENEFDGQGEVLTEGQDEDFDALAAAAYNDVAAQTRLNELAVEAGVSEEDVASSEKWEDVVAMIRTARETGGEETGGGEEPTPDEEEQWKPAKGEVVFYLPKVNGKPQLGKNKKPLRIEVEVLTSDPKTQCCTLKDLTTKKPILGPNKKPLFVKWDDLVPE